MKPQYTFRKKEAEDREHFIMTTKPIGRMMTGDIGTMSSWAFMEFLSQHWLGG
jgi:hypothetical protein